MPSKTCSKCGTASKYGVQLASASDEQEYIVCANCIPGAFTSLYNELPKDTRDGWVQAYFGGGGGIHPMSPLGL